MPSLADLPRAIRKAGPLPFARQLLREIDRDDVFTLGAALAYSWTFAVFPFLIFLLTLLPYLPAQLRADADRQVSEFLFDTLPRQAAQVIDENVKSVLNQPRGELLSIGLIVTLWAASGGMNTTMSAMEACYNVRGARPLYRKRPLAMLLTIIVISMVILILVLLPVGGIVTAFLRAHDAFDISAPIIWALNFSRWFLGVALMLAALCVIYHWGPAVKQRFRLLTPGAAFCIVVWIALGLGFRWYIENFGRYDKTYGAVGGVAILLLLFYLYAVVMLIGAQINSEVDRIVLDVPDGSRDFRRPHKPAPTAPPPSAEASPRPADPPADPPRSP